MDGPAHINDPDAGHSVMGDGGAQNGLVLGNPDTVHQIAPEFAMSVDVEDYFQVWAFSDVIDRSSWDGFAPRVETATRQCLEIFARHQVTATFFTLGWVAERFPGLVRSIVDEGHELASHGYDHQKIFDQTKDEFSEDVSRTKKILEDISGKGIVGFRAAGFSLDERSPWAYDVLASAGYKYSSSSHPIAHDHYGDPSAPQGPHCPIDGDPFVEAPVATATVLGRRISCAGGGWFRASPYAVSKALIKKSRQQTEGPLIFYFHPWEIDVDQPRIASASPKSKLRHYLNLSRMVGKIENLAGEFRWGRIDHALAPFGLHQ
ncbi:MAG: XrtA system polysaccharide deacetylase [Pseudomonadota bacterium]